MKPQILVVEDDEVTGDLLKFLLERDRFEVLWLKDGRQVLDCLENEVIADAILLDLMLPYISGLQLIPRIRSHDRWQKVPIVVITTDATEEHVVQALDAGADDYVTKPFRAEELMARLRRVLRYTKNV
ncbi:MAG: response regulator transcription factor [Cyanosarcina radialis HA8281-LM2]|jgi:two-component system phosphate regulon response regulator PhoB|nr:response regulator transcription factor [Cyanosarcina radialis HA8281-LM2]